MGPYLLNLGNFENQKEIIILLNDYIELKIPDSIMILKRGGWEALLYEK